jgi:hypothetical protein
VLKSIGISEIDLGEKTIVTKSCELLLDAFQFVGIIIIIIIIICTPTHLSL